MFNEERMQQLNEIIDKSVVVTSKTVIGGMYLARTGIHIASHNDMGKQFIGGFSCKTSPDEAALVARYECKERVFSMFDFRTDSGECYPVYSLSCSDVVGRVTADKVQLGPGKDAVGLSAHTSHSAAVRHAANEVVERALLGRLFYDALPLALCSEEIIDGNICRYYTTADDFRSGFVVAVLAGRHSEFLTLGASRSDSFQLALRKARAECIMLAENIFKVGRTDHIPNENSRRRMHSQTDKRLIEIRRDFIDRACTKTISISEDAANIETALTLCGGSDIQYCVLAESKDLVIVRANPNGFPTLADFRLRMQNSTAAEIDFVC